jgi:hypothetical protein
MVLARARGHHLALINGGGARNLPANATTATAARATTSNVGWPGGSTASATDTIALCVSSAVHTTSSAIRASSGGAYLGSAAVDTPALRRPRLRRRRRHRCMINFSLGFTLKLCKLCLKQ